MNLIKLDATDSTNDYLKQLLNHEVVENFSVVVAKSQTKGKGQMGAVWKSELGKNLTFSILIKNNFENSNQIFDLNVAVAVAIIQVLDTFKIPELAIKWPNDILSGNTKIGGILIENSFKHDKTIASIVGIGLNVNQTDFENLPKASSLSKIRNQKYDLDLLLAKIVLKIKENCQLIIQRKSQLLWDFYHYRLFKKDVEMEFETQLNFKFSGIIQGVSKTGLLEVLVDKNVIKRFSIKEIQMIY